jgi:hypothetical protein
MAMRASINLDFDVILKNYRTNQRDGPVRAHFVKWHADVKAANEATVTIADGPPQVTLAWGHYGTAEKFRRVPGGNPKAMSGISNKYGALTATKMQV